MSEWDHYEYRISQHFACFLEYGDFGDMTEEEIQQIEEWVTREQGGKTGYWSIQEINEDYGKCEVTGSFSNLMSVRYNFKG